jgi:hypothetical protein
MICVIINLISFNLNLKIKFKHSLESYPIENEYESEARELYIES